MLRISVATLAGLCGLLAYIAGVVSLFDTVQKLPQVVHLLYFLLAGIAWVIPARSLMFWAARHQESG